MANSFCFATNKKMVDATDLAGGNVDLIALGDTLSGGSRRALLRCSGWAPAFEMRESDVESERVWRLSIRPVQIKVKSLVVAQYDIPGTTL